MSWQSIEKEQRDAGEYLCVTTGCPWWPDKSWAPEIELLYFSTTGAWTNYESIERTVTHWQPLPALPERSP